MADSSFDVVSKVDRQEVDNALNQAAKELGTRFDFRGTDTRIEWQGEETITTTPSPEERPKPAIDVFKEKLIRRDISMKAFDAGEPQASGKTYKVSGTIKQGISSEDAKKITKLIRDDGPKGVKTQIQGDEVRVSSKKRDDLQAIIAMLKGADTDVALQFVNYRERTADDRRPRRTAHHDAARHRHGNAVRRVRARLRGGGAGIRPSAGRVRRRARRHLGGHPGRGGQERPERVDALRQDRCHPAAARRGSHHEG